MTKRPFTAAEIRQSFLNYFTDKGHTVQPSSSLVPYNDQTLLFTNAGMVQFKDVFLGMEQKAFKRATTAQRCLRAGGKHNDLETVGKTARHHTFFEMLGNFSFGDYFKRDAILFAWDFLTNILELDKEKLYVTVFEKDDESFALWQELTDVTPERIYRIGAKDNFWSMGDTGPCGPCSEIFYDRGESFSCGDNCGIGKCDCDRYMEIWNLVFMQYDRNEKGDLTPLAKPCIDTGMGLERIASVIQKVNSNYDTDIMQSLIKKVEEITGKSYDQGEAGFPFRVIADHARACTFMIYDRILPSNEGRGYVLRRILRRAVRFGRMLGQTGPFLYQLVATVAETLKDVYPDLPAECEKIAKVIYQEEERFFVTLQDGLNIFAGIIDKIKADGRSQISGDEAFLLYDTFGFPIDLMRDVAEENGFTLDVEGFEAAMARQKAMARAARAEQAGGGDFIALGQLLLSVEASDFCGYTQLEAVGKVTALVFDGDKVEKINAGQSGWLVLDKTPFYAESGGQVGDSGLITKDGLKIKVEDTRKLPSGLFVHRVSVETGTVALGDSLNAAVDGARRRAITANHSATHLLHRSLRDLLGEEVHQSGSFVSEDYLRFDFNYSAAVDKEDLQKIEDAVNERIFANLPISSQEMPKDEAIALGAAAFFGDKYGDVVRVVTMGDYSLELCGGCHAASTAEIGPVKIISEGGIASGLRRIEMLTGKGTLAYYKEEERRVAAMAALMKANPVDTEKRLEKLLAENKEMKSKLEKIAGQAAGEGATSLGDKALSLGGLKVVVQSLDDIADMNALRGFVDAARDKTDISVLLFGAAIDDKVQFVAAADKKAQAAGVHAGNLIKAVAKVCGGGGGGRPDMAQAGGKDTSKLAEALNEGERIIKEILS